MLEKTTKDVVANTVEPVIDFTAMNQLSAKQFGTTGAGGDCYCYYN